MAPRAYTIAQVADLLSSSPATVRREIAAGRLSAFRHGAQLRISEAALADYMRPVCQSDATKAMDSLAGMTSGRRGERESLSPQARAVFDILEAKRMAAAAKPRPRPKRG